MLVINTPLKQKDIDENENIVDALDASDALAIAGHIVEFYDKDLNDCDEYHKKMKKYLGVCDNDDEHLRASRLSGGSRLHYTLLTDAANEFLTTFINEFPFDSPVRAKNAKDVPSQEDVAVTLAMSGQIQEGQDAKEIVTSQIKEARIANHKALMDSEDAVKILNYQFTEDMPDWVEETQELAKLLCVQGSVIRKYTFCPIENRPIHKIIKATDFVVNKCAKTIEGAKRLSECVEYRKEDITPLYSKGYFKQKENDTDKEDDTDYSIIEMSLRLDLDGDGYPEPYVAWVLKEDSHLLRLEKNFDKVVRSENGKAILIKSKPRYCKYSFLPSGDFWGKGFGAILEMSQNALSSILNLTIDAGAKSTLGGGIYSADSNTKDRIFNFSPGEWKGVRATGQSIRDSFMPIPNPEPSQTLMAMMQLLDSKSSSLANLNQMNSENFTSNTAPTTAMIMAEESTKKLRAVLKRFYAEFKKEIQSLVDSNKKYFNTERYVELTGVQIDASAFDNKEIVFLPNKDLDSIGNARQMAQVQFFESKTQDLYYDAKRTRKEVLRLMGIDNPDYYLTAPPEAQPAQPDPLMTGQLELGKMQLELQKLIADNKNQIDTLRLLLDNEYKQDKLEIDRVKAVSEIENDILDAQLQSIDLRNQPNMEQVDDRGQQDINNQQSDNQGTGLDGVGTDERSTIPTGIPEA